MNLERIKHFDGSYLEIVIPLSSGISPDDKDHLLTNLKYDKIFKTKKALKFLSRSGYKKRDYRIRCYCSLMRTRKYISPYLLNIKSCYFLDKVEYRLFHGDDILNYIKDEERFLKVIIRKLVSKFDGLDSLLLEEYLNSLYMCYHKIQINKCLEQVFY